MRPKPPDFQRVLDDTPENREAMFEDMLRYDEVFVHGMKRQGMPFFLGVVKQKIAFMNGADATSSFQFIIGQWTPWSGLKRVDLPSHEIRWVSHL